MFRVTTNPETGKIASLQVQDAVFSYSYLVSPRPETDFSPGTYGTELIIKDPETLAAIKQYLNEVMEEAKTTTWDGKVPKNLHLPIKKGNEESDAEAGHWVLKTSSKQQPKLFIRNEESGRAHEVSEDELDEIYAGMIGEAIVKFRAYSYNGIKGVKAYLNAVCKTENGTPFAASTSYEDTFSLENEFDAAPAPTPKKPSKPAKVETTDSVDLDSLLAEQPTTKAEPGEMTIDDLLNS